MPDTAVVLVNLGSPRSPEPRDVAIFLKHFLSDRRVVDAPSWYWKPLLYGLIAPLRSKRSAQAYQKVWWPEGSPIRVISERQRKALEAQMRTDLGERAPEILVAETYGEPGILQTCKQLEKKKIQRICFIPLYPQYSATTTGAVIDQLADYFWQSKSVPSISLISSYCVEPLYIEALKQSVEQCWETNGRSDKLLISFHGIPEEYVTAGDPYQEQCEATAHALANALGLAQDNWQISYQSRFGPKKWIQPYTDEVLENWAKTGVNSVTVISPAFAADCLETLEELAIGSQQVFLSNGGERFDLVPCLNDSPSHIELLAKLVYDNLPT